MLSYVGEIFLFTLQCTNICENKTPLCQRDGTSYAHHGAQTFVKTIPPCLLKIAPLLQ